MKWKKIIPTILVWGATSLLLPILLDDYQRLYDIMPSLYVFSMIVLLFIYYIGDRLLSKKHHKLFVLFLILGYATYRYLVSLLIDALPSSSFNVHTSALTSMVLRSKIYLKLIILFMGTTLIIIINYVYRLRIERKTMIEENLKAELSLLKTQINPHFFFNSLNSIYHLALTKDNRAPAAIIALSDMMRYVLTDAKSDFVDVEKEADYLNRYIELQKDRLPHTTKIYYTQEIDYNHTIAPLLLISFFENAFKYGVSATYETSIHINLTIKEGKLHLKTQNNIFKNSENRYGTASGVKNVIRRLELLYNNKYTLEIDESQTQYTSTLRIDLR